MDSQRSSTKWYFHLTDFANILKAFIGSNYLSIGFSFKQSGLVLGIFGLLFIAILTDHCCHLLVKSKYYAINHFVPIPQTDSPSSSSSDNSDDKTVEIDDQTVHTFTYGDIAKIAFGKIGLYVVNVCIFLTQYGFCVGYFIFIGNTLFSLFPYKAYNVTFTNATEMDTGIENHRLNDSYINKHFSYYTADSMHSLPVNTSTSNSESFVSSRNVSENVLNISTTTAPTSTEISVNWTHLSDTVMKSTAISKSYIILMPLPIFIAFSYFRHVRHLGITSLIANISIMIGCVALFFFLVIDFSVSNCYELANVRDFLLFFGMVTASYEGIGCIIPIESSMENNRHNFPMFLHGAVILLSVVLLVFGILGYLRFGEDIAQMVNVNIPANSFFSFATNIGLCIGVILTFPLQMFPVIQLAELYIFRDDQSCCQKKNSTFNTDDDDDDMDQTSYHVDNTAEDNRVLLPKNSSDTKNNASRTVSSQVATWKRNIVRMFLVMSAAGLAIVFRNSFAYIGGFVGAIGSTTLSYIMPSLIHNKLGGVNLKWYTKMKNLLIVVIGVVCGVASLCAVVIELINAVAV